MSDLQKQIDLKLDVLAQTRRTIKKGITGSIKEQQESQEERLVKELMDLKADPELIKAAGNA